MGRIQYQIPEAFEAGRKARSGSFWTDGSRIYSYGMLLVSREVDGSITWHYPDRSDPSFDRRSATTNLHMLACERVIYRNLARESQPKNEPARVPEGWQYVNG